MRLGGVRTTQRLLCAVRVAQRIGEVVGEQVDDFLAGHSCFGEEQAGVEFGSLIVSCFLCSPAQVRKRHLFRMKRCLLILLCVAGNLSAKSWTKGLSVHWVSQNPKAVSVFNEKSGERIGDLKEGYIRCLRTFR